MLPTIPARPTWAGTRDTADLAAAVRVVADPLTGQIPTWATDPGRLIYDDVAAELGDPFALDGRTWAADSPPDPDRHTVADAPETKALALAGRAA